jgi:hypothetical protein
MTSIIKVDQIQTAAGATPTAGDLGINTTGNVINVAFADTNSKYAATASFSFLPINYTPKYSNSKLLITYNVGIGLSNVNGSVGIRRDGSFIGTQVQTAYVGPIQGLNSADDGIGASRAYDINMETYQLMDTPNTTSQVTYDFYWALNSGNSGNVYLNRQSTDNGGSTVSTVSIIEIAG